MLDEFPAELGEPRRGLLLLGEELDGVVEVGALERLFDVLDGLLCGVLIHLDLLGQRVGAGGG